MITSDELSNIIRFGREYSEKKFRDQYGEKWKFETGFETWLDLRIDVDVEGMGCTGTTSYGYETDYQCSMYIPYDEILDEYRKYQKEIKQLQNEIDELERVVNFWERVDNGTYKSIGFTDAEIEEDRKFIPTVKPYLLNKIEELRNKINNE